MMKKWLPWVATFVLLIGAWFVQLLTPSDDAASEPFIVATVVGSEAVGREIVVTVLDVRAASAVTSSNGWSAEGTWLLVDLKAEAVRNDSLLKGATLTIGDREFRASERMDSIFSTKLVPGIPRTGTIAFELPDDALTGTGILHLSPSGDTRLDSVIELTIPLDELTISAEESVHDTEWATS